LGSGFSDRPADIEETHPMSQEANPPALGQSVIHKAQFVAERRKPPGASLTGRLAPYRYLLAGVARKTDQPCPPSKPLMVERQTPGMSVVGYVGVLVMGAYLGILFVKSEVAQWDRIHKMFLFQEAYMYLIIGVAIVVAMISMYLIKRLGLLSLEGEPIVYKPKPFHAGVIIGGMLFGAGWAIAGACPGPIYAQIGGGQWMAVCTLAGALLGMFSYAALKPKLPH
jgi:uncharacterized membrane protein YedE/YeeE